MDDELLKKIQVQEAKLDSIYASVEKLRKYFLWTLIITVATVVLPLLVLVIMLPWLMGTLGAAYGGLGI